MHDFYDVSIIGGADGPTAVFVAGQLWKVGIAAVAVIAVIVLLCLFIKHNNQE